MLPDDLPRSTARSHALDEKYFRLGFYRAQRNRQLDLAAHPAAHAQWFRQHHVTSRQVEGDSHIQQREQEQIFDAIAHQHRDAARAAMRLHLINSLLRLRAKP